MLTDKLMHGRAIGEYEGAHCVDSRRRGTRGDAVHGEGLRRRRKLVGGAR